ncbi:hypothetical protein [Geobacter sp.]|uniref:hypothetical protein n=1 Tax=Geobacter sp. TaxID=46610 RepID=UPI002616EB52|nr:hypothetical protein [Geobacter sp.]
MTAKVVKPASEQPAAAKVSRLHKPDDMPLEEWQLLLRRQFGEKQDFRLENVGDDPLFSDYQLTNPASGRTYRLVVRGAGPGDKPRRFSQAAPKQRRHPSGIRC